MLGFYCTGILHTYTYQSKIGLITTPRQAGRGVLRFKARTKNIMRLGRLPSKADTVVKEVKKALQGAVPLSAFLKQYPLKHDVEDV